jgi:hypothetical protein
MSGIFLTGGKMMEIYGTIHFKLILPHFPGFQQEPLPAPVCSRSPECDGCPYPRHGFLCWGADGTCLRTRMNKINGLESCKQKSIAEMKKVPQNLRDQKRV